jgi:hypothetical protein
MQHWAISWFKSSYPVSLVHAVENIFGGCPVLPDQTLVPIRVARFSLVQHTKNGEKMPNDHKICTYSKWTQNIPTFSVERPSKNLHKIGIFGLKTCSPATLVPALDDSLSYPIRPWSHPLMTWPEPRVN